MLLLLQNLLINKDTGRAYDADSRSDSGGNQIGLQLAHLVCGELQLNNRSSRKIYRDIKLHVSAGKGETFKNNVLTLGYTYCLQSVIWMEQTQMTFYRTSQSSAQVRRNMFQSCILSHDGTTEVVFVISARRIRQPVPTKSINHRAVRAVYRGNYVPSSSSAVNLTLDFRPTLSRSKYNHVLSSCSFARWISDSRSFSSRSRSRLRPTASPGAGSTFPVYDALIPRGSVIRSGSARTTVSWLKGDRDKRSTSATQVVTSLLSLFSPPSRHPRWHAGSLLTRCSRSPRFSVKYQLNT